MCYPVFGVWGGPMEDELRQLTADIRQWVRAEEHRGVRVVPQSESTASASALSTSDATSDAWFNIAATSRSDGTRNTLADVRAELGDCRRCALSQNRRNIVFGVGSEGADLLIIGEAPGYHEDQSGEPFVGPAGQMLDKMLENVLGLQRAHVYIANVVKCRPPKNRNPLPDEVASCRVFLEAQFDAIQPKVVLVLGSVALKTLFDTHEGIKRCRGKWMEWRGVPVMPTFHPAYLLRNSEDKRLTFHDLKALRARYDSLSGIRP